MKNQSSWIFKELSRQLNAFIGIYLYLFIGIYLYLLIFIGIIY